MEGKEYRHFIAPVNHEINFDTGTFSVRRGNGYEIYTEIPTTLEKMEKVLGVSVIGISNQEDELKEYLASIKKRHADMVERGRILWSLIIEDGTPQSILPYADQEAINIYRESRDNDVRL